MVTRSHLPNAALFALAIVAIGGCSREPSEVAPIGVPPTTTRADAANAPTVDASAVEARAPLGGFPANLDLVPPAGAKEKTRYGMVTVPLGAREPRPLVVALHGGSDRPEWACSAWRSISEGHAFVVCPRGPGSESALGLSLIHISEPTRPY